MKILLIRPPTTLKVAQRLQSFLNLEPLALEIVAGGVPAPHEVRILDFACIKNAEAELVRTLSEYRPDVIGFTAYSNQAASIKCLAALAKSRLPNVFSMVGGIHATIAADDLRLPGTFDLVVRGEGGVAMRELIGCLERKEPVPESPVFLPTSSPNFAALAASPPPELPPYEQVPVPRRDLVDRARYHCVWHGRPGERLPTLFPRTAAARTSVGCPYRCSFCVVHFLAHGKYLRRTPEDVVNELATIPEEHVYFVDDEMFIDTKRAMAIARLLIERGVRKKYVSWARADTIVKHRDMFALWKQAGLSLVYVGLESMESENLADYNKALSPEVNKQAIAILQELSIGLHASLMVNPDFTKADFEKVHRAIKAVAPAELSFTVFSPPPGTDIWKKHRAEFCCPDPHAFYDGMHTLLPTRMPLKKFYRSFAFLWLLAARHNPLVRTGVKIPIKDWARFLCYGFLYGFSLQHIYLDYPRAAQTGTAERSSR